MSDGVTGRKLKVLKACLGAGDEGFVSCRDCFVARLLYVTHNQIHRVVQERVNAAALFTPRSAGTSTDK